MKSSISCTFFVLATLACTSLSHAKNSTLPDRAKEAVREVLIDPSSAKFKIDFQDAHLLCGRVNAKNRMGGYNGFRRFLYSEAPGKDVQLWMVNPDLDPADGMTEELLHSMLAQTVCDDMIKKGG